MGPLTTMKQNCAAIQPHSFADMKKVVIYTRISKDREDQTSITTQEQSCRAYAESKGWDVISVYTDLGKSAFKRGVKRPELEAALNLVEVGAANVLLVWKLDRFSRSTGDFQDYWERIDNAGGQFASVTESFDTSGHMGRAMLKIIAIFAELESGIKSDRTQEWNDYRSENGLAPGGTRPFGYQRNNGMLEIDPVEGPWLQQAAISILNGASLHSLVKESQMTGTRGKPLTTRGLRSALLNPTTAGKRESKGKLVSGIWPAILDMDTFTDLQTLLTDPARQTNGGSNKTRNLLSGIMVCGKDDCDGFVGIRNWTTRKGVQRQRYQCRICGNSIWKDTAESRVRDFILSLVDQTEWNNLRTQGRGYDPRVVAEIEASMNVNHQMFRQGTIAAEVYQDNITALNDRLASAMGDEPLILPEVSNLAEGWEGMTVQDQRMVVKAILKSVVLNPQGGRWGNVPDRITCHRIV